MILCAITLICHSWLRAIIRCHMLDMSRVIDTIIVTPLLMSLFSIIFAYAILRLLSLRHYAHYAISPPLRRYWLLRWWPLIFSIATHWFSATYISPLLILLSPHSYYACRWYVAIDAYAHLNNITFIFATRLRQVAADAAIHINITITLRWDIAAAAISFDAADSCQLMIHIHCLIFRHFFVDTIADVCW